MRMLIVFYSAYGHIYKMAEAAAEGALRVKGIEAVLRQVAETLPVEVQRQTGSLEARKAFAHIPVCTVSELGEADALMIGTPTRFGNMCCQIRQFLDGTSPLWKSGALVGKVAGVFTSTATQHGGQESTILSVINTLLHLGMVIAGLPYTFQGQMRLDEISGCSPYGASTIAGGDGLRLPSKNELDGIRFQGEYIAGLTSRLKH